MPPTNSSGLNQKLSQPPKVITSCRRRKNITIARSAESNWNGTDGGDKDSRSNAIHPLRRQLQTDRQQLARDIRLFFSKGLPILCIKTPCHAILLCLHRRCPPRLAEEWQLAARPSSNNELKVPALREIVLCAQHPGLKEIKCVGDVAFSKQSRTHCVGRADEVRARSEPEIFVA